MVIGFLKHPTYSRLRKLDAIEIVKVNDNSSNYSIMFKKLIKNIVTYSLYLKKFTFRSRMYERLGLRSESIHNAENDCQSLVFFRMHQRRIT
jgi:hypothetical protein